MGHDALRHDTECQNCGHTVAQKYCPNCGQKNTETRQSFGHLVGHFAEDLTHYDSAFWKTIKYLLFRPGFLTTEYLIGKRQSFVPPVKLYIFVSFLAFFIPGLIPSVEQTHKMTDDDDTYNVVSPLYYESKDKKIDEKAFGWFPNISMHEGDNKVINPIPYTSIKQMDSIEALKPDSLKMNSIHYKAAKKLITVYEHNTSQEVFEKLWEGVFHNIPKTLFVYMPLFAFWIWLFHGKKRWYFFDHSIFTLHYFSFLLLTSAFLVLLSKITYLVQNETFSTVCVWMILLILFWQIYYFYRSHRKMYHEKWLFNFIKCTALFLINIFLIVILFILLLLYSYYNLH